ncbi:response regulator transcription factor [Granulicella aggregans]|uniref:response regulator transcription factor n=1 Tax=Granulicella aggregans TaxID=474949 RepID=UPI0021E0C1B0|nr:response regulator [Granulicella aggregans]
MQPIALKSRLEPVALAAFAKFPSPKQLPSREAQEVVYVIDEALDFRESLIALLRFHGFEAVGFGSACEYLRHGRHDGSACLIVDFHLRDICSLELLRQLKEQAGPPVIFLSGSPDVPNAVSAMRAGAMEFFEKPLDPDSLLPAVRLAFVQHRKIRQKEEELARLKGRLLLLTPREREVLPLVVGGVLNQRAAVLLGISKVTLQIHRSQVMRKMVAESVADLVRMAVKLRIPYRCESQMAQAHNEEDQRRWRSEFVAS